MKIILFFLLSIITKAADVGIAWNPNAIEEKIAFYQVRAEELWGMQIITGTTDLTTYTFHGLRRGVTYTISVVAVNSVGVSNPAMIAYLVPYRIRLTDMKGSDLEGWEVYETHEINVDKPKEFFRRKIEYLP